MDRDAPGSLDPWPLENSGSMMGSHLSGSGLWVEFPAGRGMQASLPFGPVILLSIIYLDNSPTIIAHIGAKVEYL